MLLPVQRHSRNSSLNICIILYDIRPTELKKREKESLIQQHVITYFSQVLREVEMSTCTTAIKKQTLIHSPSKMTNAALTEANCKSGFRGRVNAAQR